MRYAAESWEWARRVLVKAEQTELGRNPRFVVTNREGQTQKLYQELDCARGEMEHRIKEQQLGLFADRTSFASREHATESVWLWLVGQPVSVAVEPGRVCAVGTAAGAGVGGPGVGARRGQSSG